MDTTPKYIKMCEQAQEIQNNTPNCLDTKSFFHFVETDKIARNIVKDFVNRSSAVYETSGKIVWLPRQDQLQEICLEVFKEHDLVPEFIEFFNEINLKFGFSFALGNDWDSLEKVWLAFVMKEKYNKIWNNETENWDTHE